MGERVGLRQSGFGICAATRGMFEESSSQDAKGSL